VVFETVGVFVRFVNPSLILRAQFWKIEWVKLIILKSILLKTDYCFEVLHLSKEGNEKIAETVRRGGHHWKFSAGDLKKGNDGMIT
jgi:hypothetical protein